MTHPSLELRSRFAQITDSNLMQYDNCTIDDPLLIAICYDPIDLIFILLHSEEQQTSYGKHKEREISV